ncbi:MAG TPA: YgdI/YgdR family lipoprotein [Candidatus Anaerobutyricum stercoris]|uniref:YgdI/YgdR family lipoprotein n=1 Tax=Candidatus Anaerobutyricum stercoris TaxID=2838457 RepID=A0A9D2EJZ0_9FIRM|nr:YgdI/YgdR family lipoprotein [Candidatus Anaerobutyricum stercoris]
MRKKTLFLSTAFLFSLALSGCSSNQKVTEYNIDDFSAAYNNTIDAIEDETQYWSDEEKESKEYQKIVEKHAKENGFSINMPVMIRGKFNDIIGSYLFLNADDDTDINFGCDFQPPLDELALLTPNENIAVEGTLFKTYESESGEEEISEFLEDCEVVSPNLDEVEFEDNTSDILESDNYSDRIMGTVASVVEITDSEEYREFLVDNSSTYVEGESDFALAYRYATHTVSLDLDNGNILLCLVDEKVNETLPKSGDKISLIGKHFTYLNDNFVDAVNSPIYIFNKE